MEDVQPFWHSLEEFGNNIALLEGSSGTSVTYKTLAEEVGRAADQLSEFRGGLIFLPLGNKINDIILYLAALRVKAVPLILTDKIPRDSLKLLVNVYQPDLIFGQDSNADGYRSVTVGGATALISTVKPTVALDGLLGLLLSTSGSTGSAKLVRLSHTSLDQSAAQVIDALSIVASDRAVTSIPSSHVYGLSIINSHLKAGASILLEERSIMESGFWRSVETHSATSFAGVPWTYQTLKKSGIRLPDTFKSITTSGGKIDPHTRDWMVEQSQHRRLYFMYGQTEAAGRISVLQPELVREKIGSVGKAVCGGTIRCSSDGSVIYQGPNVMMGYASRQEDLSRSDDIDGCLDTGDLGYLDDDGFLFLTGRKSEICKILGNRVNLSEISQFLLHLGVDAHISQDLDDTVSITHEAHVDVKRIVAEIAARFRIPNSAISLRAVTKLERLPNGKLGKQNFGERA